MKSLKLALAAVALTALASQTSAQGAKSNAPAVSFSNPMPTNKAIQHPAFAAFLNTDISMRRQIRGQLAREIMQYTTVCGRFNNLDLHCLQAEVDHRFMSSRIATSDMDRAFKEDPTAHAKFVAENQRRFIALTPPRR